MESAFLKDTTDVYNISFQTEKTIRIKIEVDTVPPPLFSTEQKMLPLPKSFLSRCVTLPDLFAGKMHALAFRAWKTRVKGRDWYDFEWYVHRNVPLDWNHLRERIRQFNGQDYTWDQYLNILRERLASADMEQVKEDVRRFLRDEHELDFWSNDYFLQLADSIKVDG